MTENELVHFGIKGMKWGVRRYQKEDGTLTSKGKNRYATTTRGRKDYRNKKYKPVTRDVIRYGKKGAQRIADRQNNGDSRKKAVAKELGRRVVTRVATAAILKVTTNAILNGTAEKAVKSAINAGRNIVNSRYNMEILDSTGKVLKRYKSAVTVGEEAMSMILRKG